jgi:hypothetical protein
VVGWGDAAEHAAAVAPLHDQRPGVELVLAGRLPEKSSPLSVVPLFPMRGRVREIADDATADGSPVHGPPRTRRPPNRPADPATARRSRSC